jgi:predicted  nucleic acid-binding Zn-ribbon protein
MYVAKKMSVAEVQDEIRKVEEKLEELGKQTQEDVEKMSKVEKDTSMEGERVSFEGERTVVTDGTPALAMWTM